MSMKEMQFAVKFTWILTSLSSGVAGKSSISDSQFSH